MCSQIHRLSVKYRKMMKLMIALPIHWSLFDSMYRYRINSHIVGSLIYPFVRVLAPFFSLFLYLWQAIHCKRCSLETCKHFTVRTLQFHVYIPTLKRFKINLLNYLFMRSPPTTTMRKKPSNIMRAKTCRAHFMHAFLSFSFYLFGK